MEKRLNAIQLAAILRIWSACADKTIPLSALVEGMENNPNKNYWLKFTQPIIEFMDWMNLDHDKYCAMLAAIIHWQFMHAGREPLSAHHAWKRFMSMHPQNQKLWLDEAQFRIGEING